MSYSTKSNSAISELEALRAVGAFDQVESLLGKYAGSNADVSADGMIAMIHEDATAWESEIEEFYGNET